MLTPAERDRVKRLLSEPDELPQEFKDWLRRELALAPPKLLSTQIDFGQQPGYTISGASVDRAYTVGLTTLTEIANVLATLIHDLQEKGVVQ